jgi:hypothetical protein
MKGPINLLEGHQKLAGSIDNLVANAQALTRLLPGQDLFNQGPFIL